MQKFFEELCKSFDLRLQYNVDSAVLIDPQSGAYMEISVEEYFTDSEKSATISEYTVRFSTQHRHFDSFKEVEKYVRSILSDEVLPIEFFDNSRAKFGGEIKKEDLNGISAQRLAQMFGYTAEYISQFYYELHSWSGKNDIKRTKVSDIGKKVKALPKKDIL